MRGSAGLFGPVTAKLCVLAIGTLAPDLAGPCRARDNGNHMFSVIVGEGPIDGRHANLADFCAWTAGPFWLRPLGDIANLGLTLTEAKQLLARVQCEVSTAQAREHAVRRPVCLCGEDVCRVKDYRGHSVATPFGQVTMRLPRFLCALCGRIETGINWPSHCRSTPELDRLRAHLSALMSYPVAADLLEQMFPVEAGTDPETLRRHTLKVGAALADRAMIRPETAASAIAITLDSTFIRSCEDGERHLEVRMGNTETRSGRRQVFGAVAKAGTDIEGLIRRNLDAVGGTGAPC
jgi:hypothetical protein